MPYRFARLHLLGRISDAFTEDGLELRATGKLAFAPARVGGTARLTLPLDNAVVRFP